MADENENLQPAQFYHASPRTDISSGEKLHGPVKLSNTAQGAFDIAGRGNRSRFMVYKVHRPDGYAYDSDLPNGEYEGHHGYESSGDVTVQGPTTSFRDRKARLRFWDGPTSPKDYG